MVQPAPPGGSYAGYNSTSSSVWQAWNWSYNASSTTTITNLNDPWQAWNGAYNTGSMTTSATIFVPQWQSWNFQYEETAEQRATREAEQAAWEAGRAEREVRAEQQRAEQERERERYQKVRLAAQSRAEQLLMTLLNDEQVRTYREHGWFEVRGSRGGRYRIRNRGQAGNVDLMPEIGNERDVSYCCHPPGQLPNADAHVAQMLHLVTDEDDFLKTANVSYQRPGLRQVEAARARLVA